MSLAELPWPAMAVDSAGEVAASRSFQELTGVEGPLPSAVADRFEIARFGGGPLQDEELPWRRAGRGESFSDDEIWYDRQTSQRLFLHVQSYAEADRTLIAFENVADQPFSIRLADLIASVGSCILRTEEPSALAHAVLEDLAGVLGADAVFLLAAEFGGRLRLLASLGVPSEFSEESQEPNALLIDTIMARAALTRENQEVHRIEDLPEGIFQGTRRLLDLGLHSAFAVPLLASGELMGVLEVARRQRGKLNALERRVLRGAAVGCALALRQARLLAAEHRETERLRTLREAALAIGAALPLRDLLRQLVAQACELTRARYGALGVLDAGGHGLADFIFVGVSEEIAARIGRFPIGRGLLGVTLRSAQPIRVADIRKDPRSIGFPPHHPTMTSFLGLPLLLGTEIFGNLYLCDKDGGIEFTEEDERLVQLLAAQSSLAIAYARQLKMVDQIRDEFAAVIAHDLRSPVSSMILQIDALLRRAQGDRVSVPLVALERLRRSGTLVSRLAGDLLDASRIELGRLTLERSAVSLGDAVRELLAEIEPTLGDHPVSIDVQGEPPPVSADHSRLDQIVTNLLDNAAKYSAPGKPIRVLIAPAPGGATLTVEDRGIGIEQADMPRLFDRFYQGQRARAKKTGLGLGLYITKGLVEAHGGTISVESTPGEGSRFRIWLPQAKPDPTERATALH